ncbi:hypothetical protein B0T26DRAFT_644747 [Lasiosphaeria miniovina]|uniref:Uncharacterized protein n=1 Tax=Lasiosphaeria miniovina TaxID=1954250 RepID=A0AA40AJ49_9PEZI|nr:uncharacterized protein B0T26DRAFT_644747 [Lasiosphaeria miniovina]KAK0716803.1 hypothetical protein B0T26DRAFT_644747 [Lasiosphaeria miniovina]
MSAPDPFRTECLARDVINNLVNKPAAEGDAVVAAVTEFSKQVKAAAAVSSLALADYVWTIFRVVFDIAAATPAERQGPLVDFLVQLRKAPVTGADDQPLTYEGGLVWTDLPTFGWVAREYFNYADLDLDQAKTLSLGNQLAFMAKLTAIAGADKPKDAFDFALFALWSLRTAFEEAPPAGQSAASKVKLAELAAVWVRFASDALHTMCEENRPFVANQGAPGDKYKDRKWKGFNQERWGIWLEGLKAAGIEL